MTDLADLSTADLLQWTYDERGYLPTFACDIQPGTELMDLLAEFNEDLGRIRDQAEYYENAVLDVALACRADIERLLDRIEACPETGERLNVGEACAAIRSWLETDVEPSAQDMMARRGAGVDYTAPVTLSWTGDSDTGVLPSIELPDGVEVQIGSGPVEAARRLNELFANIMEYSTRANIWLYDAVADRLDDIKSLVSALARSDGDPGSGVLLVCQGIRDWIDSHVRPTQADRQTRPKARLRIDVDGGEVSGVDVRAETLELFQEKLTDGGLDELHRQVMGLLAQAVAAPGVDFDIVGAGHRGIAFFDTEANTFDVRMSVVKSDVDNLSTAVLGALRHGGSQCAYLQAADFVMLSADRTFAEYDPTTLALARIVVNRRQSGRSLPLPDLGEQCGAIVRIGRVGPRRDYFSVDLGANKDYDFAHLSTLIVQVQNRNSEIRE